MGSTTSSRSTTMRGGNSRATCWEDAKVSEIDLYGFGLNFTAWDAACFAPTYEEQMIKNNIPIPSSHKADWGLLVSTSGTSGGACRARASSIMYMARSCNSL
ncbi:hypothetical protein SCP_1402260 [Sparassis crispa]|uniref:Uncharacterized protein n=1 Tax=Sparassis crispa TaxID=139825 RepID=A0A401H385_9APHY|nr:hypothetical protein SCP_1402260 [Sparassis crispa]GBE88820.1 hypothetical protein SCP_1402260 [Sparassis crispa]